MVEEIEVNLARKDHPEEQNDYEKAKNLTTFKMMGISE